MTRVVQVSTEQVRIPVAREQVRRIAEMVLRAERVTNAVVSVTFVTDTEIAALNWRHLRHRGPTDVISFGFAPVARGAELVGDVYICPLISRRNALAHRVPVREELLRLVVHGVLHVLGYEHPDDESRYDSKMWRRQELLLQRALAVA